MILKIFRCRVPISTRERFLAAQRQWQALHSVEGFLAQRCGFVEGESDACVIVALWKDRLSLERFMFCEHDRIVESGQQAGSYLDGRVVLSELISEVGREFDDIASRLLSSSRALLVEFESPDIETLPAAGHQYWRVLDSPRSIIGTAFEAAGRYSAVIAGDVKIRETRVRWLAGLAPRASLSIRS